MPAVYCKYMGKRNWCDLTYPVCSALVNSAWIVRSSFSSLCLPTGYLHTLTQDALPIPASWGRLLLRCFSLATDPPLWSHPWLLTSFSLGKVISLQHLLSTEGGEERERLQPFFQSKLTNFSLPEISWHETYDKKKKLDFMGMSYLQVCVHTTCVCLVCPWCLLP